MPKRHRSEFLKDVKALWPELTPELNQEGGLVHFEMDVLRRFTQQNIDRGRRQDVERCFELLERYYLEGNEKLKNAIDVSFSEALVFRNERKQKRDWDWELLPDVLKELYIQFHHPESR